MGRLGLQQLMGRARQRWHTWTRSLRLTAAAHVHKVNGSHPLTDVDSNGRARPPPYQQGSVEGWPQGCVLGRRLLLPQHT